MKPRLKAAFLTEQKLILLEHLLPIKKVSAAIRKSQKFRQIVASIKEVGIIEPLIVHPQKNSNDKYLLLDGHLRREALRELGRDSATCLVSTDDEAFTYNKRLNRITAIQEHRMILKAVEMGVSEERIAKTLNVNVASIRQKLSLLNGICPEVIELIEDKTFPGTTVRLLRRVNPIRQLEIAELMIAASNPTADYAKALLAATPQEQMVDPTKEKKVAGISADEMAQMEREMETVQRDLTSVEENYGINVVQLVVANGYVSSLIDNNRVARYLSQHNPEILAEFRNITETMLAETGETI